MNLGQLVKESNFLPMLLAFLGLYGYTYFGGTPNNPWVLLIGIAVGMPHGATDLLDENGKVNYRAVVFYGICLLLLLLCWSIVPSAALGFFLLVSILHFGTEDAVSPEWTLLHTHESLMRGSLVVLLPSLFYREEVIELFSQVSGSRWEKPLSPQAIEIGMNIWFIGLFTLFGHAAAKWSRWERVLQTFLELGLLVIVFKWLHPLEAFIVYFVAGHSIRTAFKLRSILRANLAAVLCATLFTFVCALIYFYFASTELTMNSRMIQTSFVALSLFAVPHALWRTKQIFTKKQ